jgi:hypothetical protein
MRLFICQSCGARLYFENRYCHSCNHLLGYLPEADTLTALVRPDDADPADNPGVWLPLACRERPVRFCANAEWDACNWLVPMPDDGSAGQAYCAACRFNRIVPALSDPINLARWRKIETAKHWLVYTLMRLGLPLLDRGQDPEHGLAFDFLAPVEGEPWPITGHSTGLITLNVEEAEDSIREAARAAMGEPYRTLLGHFRHEIGHFYWDLLVRDGGPLDVFRALFGDERADYSAALFRHYEAGPPVDWRDRFISPYASAHPWEDFAESWAHYLHIVDTIETANAYGLRVASPAKSGAHWFPDFDPYGAHSIAEMIDFWVPLSSAMNSLARSMGQPDLYPFILSPPVIEKLGFIRGLVTGQDG